MNATVWIFIVIAAIVVAVVANGRARRARGSIDLSLPKTHYGPGEVVRGQVTVNAKQAFEAERLVVTLTATETTETSGTKKDGSTERSMDQVFRDEREVAGARSYAAGDSQTYDFEIPLPEPAPVEKSPETVVPDQPKTKLGKASFMKEKSSLTPTTTTELGWRLSVRLAAKGVDLSTAQALEVDIEKV